MAKIQFGAARSQDGFKLFDDPETDWVFKRTLAMMSEKSAETGECLYAAGRIRAADGESWIREWAALGERVETIARACLRGGHRVSARETFLRASNYYRTAEYGCSPAHPRFHSLWQKSVDCFRAACPLFDPPIQPVEIPFQGWSLPGYFWRPDASDQARPTLIALGGNDSSGEEIFITSGFGAVRHGYNYFTFEYPGHRGAVHRAVDCVKRADYEIPFQAALDTLFSLPGVDERIALAGFSYGGYVVSRIAIHEPRLKAVIPDSPIVDLPALMQRGFLGGLVHNIPAGAMDRILRWRLRRSPLMLSFLEYSEWTWGCSTLEEELNSPAYRDHVLTADLHHITCPALALAGDGEGAEMLRQAQIFYDGISSRNKRLQVLSREKDGSNDHCQLDNISRGGQVILDWLDEIFDYSAQPGTAGQAHTGGRPARH